MSFGDLREIRADVVRAGDRLTFGDHTGWYRVRKRSWSRGRVVVHAWFRRRRIVPPGMHVWVAR